MLASRLNPALRQLYEADPGHRIIEILRDWQQWTITPENGKWLNDQAASLMFSTEMAESGEWSPVLLDKSSNLEGRVASMLVPMMWKEVELNQGKPRRDRVHLLAWCSRPSCAVPFFQAARGRRADHCSAHCRKRHAEERERAGQS